MVDIYELYGLPRPGQSRQPRRQRQQSPYEIQPFGPEEEDSMLSQLGSGAMGGLSWLGHTLDKVTGARAVRGLLGGKPEELLSVIPFSDTLGLSNPANRVTGMDLMGLPEDTSLLSPEGIGALGLEIALDPSTYLTFGSAALTKAGMKAAAKGALQKGAMSQIRAGERGLVGLGIPFLGNKFKAGAVLTGDQGAKIAEGIGKVTSPVTSRIGNAISPFTRRLGSLFDHDVRGLITKPGQMAGRQGTESVIKNLPLAKEKVLGLTRDLSELGTDESLFRQWMETGRNPFENLPKTRNMSGLKNPDGSLVPEIVDEFDGLAGMTWDELAGLPPAEQQALARLFEQSTGMPGVRMPSPDEAALLGRSQNLLDEVLQTERALGMRVGERPGYWPRQQTAQSKISKNFKIRDEGLPPLHPSQIHRQEIFEPLQGTKGINELAKDADIRKLVGIEDQMRAKKILEDMGETVPDEWADIAPTKQLAALEISKKHLGYDIGTSRSTIKNLRELSKRGAATESEQVLLKKLESLDKTRISQARRLADWVKQSVDPIYADEGLDFFGNHAMRDLEYRMVHHVNATAAADAVHDLLKATAVDATKYQPGMVNLRAALSQAGFGGGIGNTRAQQQLAGRMGLDAKDLKDLWVPGEIVKDATRYNRAFQMPEALGDFVKGWQSISNLTKTAITSLWPAFHGRNMVTGGFMNWVADAFSWKSYAAALKRRAGEVVNWANEIPALRGMTPEQASQQLSDWAYMYRVNDPGAAAWSDVTGSGQYLTQYKDPLLPGTPVKTPWGAYAEGWKDFITGKGSRNPLKTAGVGNQRVDEFALARGGREAAQAGDEVSRFAGFIELLRKGWDPEAAGRKMLEVHYDYSRLSQFEKNVMREVAPFYNWMRHNIPFTVNQLITQPGGKMGTAVKVAADLRGEPGFLPDWLGTGVAAPIGEEGEDGTQRFLSSLGLPFEDLANSLTPRGMASNLSPYIKLPIELTTGTQLYSGRQLADLHGLTGQPQVDALLYNSPVSRFATTGRQLMDPRKDLMAKALNMLTGARITDIDMEKQRDIATRDLVNNALQGRENVQSFSRQYVRPEDLPNIDPYTLQLLRLQRTSDMRRRAQQQQQRVGGGFMGP